MPRIPIIALILFSMPLVLLAQESSKTDSLFQSLEREEEDSVRCRLMLEIATELHFSDTVQVFRMLDRVKEIAGGINHRNFLGRCCELAGEIHTHYGSYEKAILEFDRALAYYNDSRNDAGYYETLKDKGNVFLYLSDYEQAMNFYITALDYYKRAGQTEGASRCLNNMGIIYKNQGKYVEALSAYDESVQILDVQEEPLQVAQAYINMGNVFVYLGNLEQALQYFDMALELAEMSGEEAEIALCMLNSGVVQGKCGNFIEAQDLYSRSLEIARSLGDPVMISNSLINLGTNLSSMGKADEGMEYVMEGLRIKEELGDNRAISNCYIHLAEIYGNLEDPERAEELYLAAIPVKKELEDLEGLVRAHLGLASLKLDVRRYREADEAADRVLMMAGEIKALEHMVSAYRIKRDIAEALGNYREAYEYANLYGRFGDSLLTEATSKAVMEMEFRHKSKVLEQENESLKVQSNLTRALMEKRDAYMSSMIGLSVLLLLGLILVYYFMRKLRNSARKLEEKSMVIMKQNLKLDNMNKTKDRMMSIIAHDLRGTIGNQLTAIEVMHHIEESGKKGIDRKKLLANLKHSASYSLELLENLLHWSRLEEKEDRFHPEELSMEVIFASCIALFDEALGGKKLKLINGLENPLTVRADRVMLEAIVRNLLSNAIKFSEIGGKIMLSAGLDGKYWEIMVEDEGIGMNEEQIRKALHNGGYSRRGTVNEKGAGIGMTLVREFAALHGGKIEVDSREGVGTRIKVLFPLDPTVNQRME